MKRVMSCILAWAMLLLLPIVGLEVPQAGAQIPDGQVPGHAIDTNESGDVVVAAVKESGRLYTRTRSDDQWSSWQTQGRDTWVSTDVAIDDDGNIALIGLKQSGAMWTRDWTPAAGWGSWARQGLATWSTETVPAIDTDAGTTTFAAVKQSGALYTRTRAADESWSSWVEHGLRTWTHADIAVFEDGVSLLAGTKSDGRLFTRVITPARGAWELHGETFSIEAQPSISLHLDVAALGAINDEGEAFVRTGTLVAQDPAPAQQWDAFGDPVETAISGIAVSVAGDRISFAYVSDTGELTKWGFRGAPGSWELVSRPVYLGFTGWSSSVSPSLAAAPREGTNDALLATHVDGGLSVFIEDTEGSRRFNRLGRSTWAAGPDTNEEAEERTEYPSGLYVVGADALPAGRYQIESPGECAWVRLSSLSSQTLLDNQVGASFDPSATQNVIDILPTDGAFQLISLGGDGCGPLKLYEAPAALASTISEGTYVVGADIEPGRYVSGTACNWSRLGDFGGSPSSELSYDLGIFDGRQIVDILPTDVGFKVTGTCQFSFRVSPPTPATRVGPGMYVVRSDIAAGRYIVTAGCSFGRFGSFIGRSRIDDAYLDLLGGFPTSTSPSEAGEWIVDLDASDIGFLLGSIDGRQCEARRYADAASPAAAPAAGSNVVGVDVEPGFYVAPGGPGCFWLRLSGFGWSASETIAGSGEQDTEILVEIEESDLGFHASSFCGDWTPFNLGGIDELVVGDDATLGTQAFHEVIDGFATISLD